MIQYDTAIALMIFAFTAGVALSYLRLRAIRSHHATYCASLHRQIERLKRDAMNDEARSLGVGGTGEHAPPTITPIDDRSRTVAFSRDDRWSIPTDRWS